ncbi:MAG: preprotein translocase subunit SecE [Fimbriimonadaceae bacterium]|nr:preprotein translocase subunit SecE [Fimbriimonadaceae bacterium]
MDKNDSAKSVTKSASVAARKFSLQGFYQDVMREMKHVTWPTRHETARLTGVVLSVCAALAFLLWLLSQGFDVILRVVIGGGV